MRSEVVQSPANAADRIALPINNASPCGNNAQPSRLSGVLIAILMVKCVPVNKLNPDIFVKSDYSP